MKTSFLTLRGASKYASALLKMGHRITFMRRGGEYFVGVVGHEDKHLLGMPALSVIKGAMP